MNHANSPLPVHEAPDPADGELAPLLAEPFASAWAEPAVAAADALRGRLLQRVAASREAAAVMVTVRRARLARQTLAHGVQAQTLYAADPARAPRPGEPLRAVLIELAPQAAWSAPGDAGAQREWLVLDGMVTIGDEALAARDYRLEPAGCAHAGLHSPTGALLFLREARLDARPGDQAFTVRDAQVGWPEFAPGIRRRVLWQRDGQAALLYHAQPGAQVPQHRHGHDEECLMVQGELFLDDVLLRAGDYQLAPAGSGHRLTHTDTGVVIYAHGDLDLQFVA